MIDAEVLEWMTVGAAGCAAGAGAGRLGRRWMCSLRRGVRPPPLWCEVGVAVLWAVVAFRAAGGALPWWWVVVPLVLGWWAVLLVVCDVLARRLPDALTLPAYPAVVALLAPAAHWAPDSGLPGAAVVGALLLAGSYALVRCASPSNLGPGDVKLAGSLGAVLGAVSVPAVLLCVLVAAVLTAVFAACARGSPVPHGPALLVPAWLVTAFPVQIAADWSALPPS